MRKESHFWFLPAITEVGGKRKKMWKCGSTKRGGTEPLEPPSDRGVDTVSFQPVSAPAKSLIAKKNR